MRYIYILVFISCFSNVFSQSYLKEVNAASQKVTLNGTEQTIVAHLYPVNEEVHADPELFYYWYSANQVNRTQGGYSGKLLNGRSG